MAEEALEELAKLSKRNLSQDYTLGELVKESNELTVGKAMLGLFLNKDTHGHVLQSIDDRLSAVYTELNRREPFYVGGNCPSVFAQNNKDNKEE